MIKAAAAFENATNDAEEKSGVGLKLRIETPENVILEYQLAGPAGRVVAYGIDFCIRMAILFVVYMVLGSVATVTSSGAAAGMYMVVRFLINWSYYTISEGFFQGRTIGKRAMGLRVIQERGYPITLWSALLRNLLRDADALPFPGVYGVGLVSMAATKKMQRVGDIVARTVVISDRMVVLPREPLIVEKIQPLPREEIGSWVPKPRVLAKIEEFLGRRYVLTHERGHALATVLASRLAERLDFQGEPKIVHKYPMAFLARVYVTFQQPADEEDEDDGFGLGPDEDEWQTPRRRQRSAPMGGRR